MHQFRSGSGSGVVQQLAESQETQLLLLLLLRVRMLTVLLRSYVVPTRRVTRDHNLKTNQNVALDTSSNAAQILGR
jgi:hypothetical protein